MAGRDDPLARRGSPLARLGDPEDGAPQQAPSGDATTAERPPEAAEPASEPAPQDLHPSGSTGEVLAVHSPKGGVGTSLLASRLACAAAAHSQLHTVFVDLNPAGGDGPAMLGVSSTRSVLELLTAPADAHRPSTAQLAEVTPAGLEVLAPTPFDPAADGLAGPMVEPLLDQLRAAYDLVVIDVPARVDDWTVSLIAAADRTLLVSVPERPCLQQIQQLLDALRAHHYSLDHLGLLHNMDDGKGAASSLAQQLDLPLAGAIPYAPSAARAAVNSSEDPTEHLTDDPIGRAVCEVARSLWPTHMTLLPPTGRLRRRQRVMP